MTTPFASTSFYTYAQRSKLCTNPTAKLLLEIMEQKQTNLALAADVTSKNRLLELAEQLGPEICILKTHIDIIDDFDEDLHKKLTRIAQKNGFLIFEDRKFADIGNTVLHQYRDGIYKIASWSNIINAHIVPGPGIIQGLQKVGLPLGRGLLLLAEMSSKGTLAKDSYTQTAADMAHEYSEFVIGFISQRKLTEDPRFIHMTPGVNLGKIGDALGQQYNTPEVIIGKNQSDVMIVGRGILEAENRVEEARRYRKAGWIAYSCRVG